MIGYLMIETTTSNDQTPVDRCPETGKLILLDAAYDLHDKHGEAFYNRTIDIIAGLVKEYGHPCGAWDEDSVQGVHWTIV